ncbi:hypothetical protein VSS37_05150, partial [Candidatus Thiothrix sp. Deng01]
MIDNMPFSQPRFDWYQVTFRAGYQPEEIFCEALRHWELSDVVQARPRFRQYCHHRCKTDPPHQLKTDP